MAKKNSAEMVESQAKRELLGKAAFSLLCIIREKFVESTDSKTFVKGREHIVAFVKYLETLKPSRECTSCLGTGVYQASPSSGYFRCYGCLIGRELMGTDGVQTYVDQIVHDTFLKEEEAGVQRNRFTRQAPTQEAVKAYLAKKATVSQAPDTDLQF
jgi:hypothetical protein